MLRGSDSQHAGSELLIPDPRLLVRGAADQPYRSRSCAPLVAHSGEMRHMLSVPFCEGKSVDAICKVVSLEIFSIFAMAAV